MMSYINETDFVIENKELVYPDIVTDGLQLYYDAKGKRDTDYHRDTMLDMSGNNNHGKLHNFAYEKHSGYKDGLVFDYIDDKLVRPTLNLQPNDFTFMLNGNIISFSPDGTVKRVQDGEVIESKGLNMLYDMERASYSSLDVKYSYNHATARWSGSNTNTFLYSTAKYNYKDKHKYYISYNAKPDSYVRLRIYANERYLDGDIDKPILNEYNFRSGILEAESQYGNHFNVRLLFGSDSVIGTKVEVKDLMMIDLTESFGAGKEPTKEQMDEIIQRFGLIPNAQDLINRIEYRGNDLGDMENIIDGLYKTEALSGEEIYTDQADDAVVHIDVDGKSYQHAGSGKNLFPKEFLSDRSNFDLSTYSANNEMIKLKPDTTYTLSSERILATPSIQVVLNIQDGTNGAKRHNEEGYSADRLTVVFNRNKHPEDGGSIVTTFTTPPSGLIYFSYYDNANGQSSEGSWFTDIMINAQLEEGSTATAYEPPAPTPDYPIEIHSLNDFDVVSQKSEGGRNLLKNTGLTDGASGWSGASIYELNGETVFRVVGTMSESANIPLEPNQYYTTTMEIYPTVDVPIGYSTPLHTYYRSSASNNGGVGTKTMLQEASVAKANEWTRIIEVVRTNQNATTYKFHVYYPAYINSTSPAYVRNIKFEKGNKATDWTPAPEDIIEDSNHPLIGKINLLLGEPLRSVGDVKDRLFRDSDGLWKVERFIEEIIIDGDTAINGVYSNDLFTTFNYSDSSYRLPNGGVGIELISTHFKKEDSGWGLDKTNISSGGTTGTRLQLYLTVPTELASTSGEMNAWLSKQANDGTPVKVLFELPAPTIETLDQKLQDKLNNLRSFQDSNYVYTVINDKTDNLSDYVADNLKPTLHAKFLYNNWYKEDRVINNLMIYNRALTNEEMLQNYKTIKRRWGM